MRIAFVFPGQGSQSVGMLGGFADNETVRGALARADEALGFSIERLIAEGPAEELNLTVNTQPAVLASSVAFYEAWLAAGGQKPELLAGHSLGEYSALCAAGVFPLEEAVKLVRFRAEAMQSAVPVGVGGMAAIIGLSDEDVEAACVACRAAGTVEAVNFNSPGQVVIAGHIEAVRAAVEDAKARGARRAIELPVSAPFHSSLLESAAKRLAERLEGVAMAEPSIPVIANVDVTVHKTPEEIRAAIECAYGALNYASSLMKPGTPCDVVLNAYTQYLTEKGYIQYCPYGSLHSTGLLECEAPTFSVDNKRVIEKNMTICIDAYFKGMSWGSFRIEDVYVIEEDGAKRITTYNDKFLPGFLKK